VRQTPGTEATQHRAVRSPQRGCVRDAGRIIHRARGLRAHAKHPVGVAVEAERLWHKVCRASEEILTPHTSIYITSTSPSAQCPAMVRKPVKEIQLR
jgi:hypothetical protein